MPEQKRAEAIAAAMERNDQDVLAAYLHGNPLLTSASPTEKKCVGIKHHVDDLDRKARIEGANETYGQCRELADRLRRFFDKSERDCGLGRGGAQS
jgi:hypothetical protein